MMATASSLKVMSFSLGDKKFRYKLLSNASENVIDSTLRKQFDIPNNVQYFLIDMVDNTVVDFSSLVHLDNGSNITVQMKEIEESTKNNSKDLQ